MAKLTLNTIGSRYGSIDALNDNFTLIEQAFENTLSRDGDAPNTLEATLDANSQRIINLPNPVSNSEPATKGWVLAQPNLAAASAEEAALYAANALVSETNAAEAASQVVDWEWKDEWATGAVYKINNLVAVPSGTYEGWTFICRVEHSAGATFSGDYSTGKWDIVAKRGSAGAGTGDMLAVNNLSELTNTTAARNNLGLVIGTNVPSPTGTGASGSWGISITGNAATATTVPDLAITSAKLASSAVTEAKIGAAAVSAAKLSGAQTGIAPIYGARAWVNFNGTGTVAIRASGNVSSIADRGVGEYTVNFSLSMPSGNHVVNVSTDSGSSGQALFAFTRSDIAYSNEGVAVALRTGNAVAYDSSIVNVAIFR
jgi:hypothetical protein